MLLLIRSLHYHKLSHPSGFGGGYKSNLVHSQPPSGISIPLHLILQNGFVVAFSPTATEKQWLWPVQKRKTGVYKVAHRSPPSGRLRKIDCSKVQRSYMADLKTEWPRWSR